ACSVPTASAQRPITGLVRDAVTREPVAGVVIRVDATRAGTLTDVAGHYSVEAPQGARLRFSRAGYAALSVNIGERTSVDVSLAPSSRPLEAVTVNALRGDAATPISQKTLDAHDLESRSFGQDVPLLLTTLAPSLTSYAESGGWGGYSYIRIRGIDQTRLNLTLDGVPLNDPEDEQLYFQNFPDFASSLQSVQIQRGIGTSAFGTAAFAGALNFESRSLAGSRPGAELELGRGSFDSYRGSFALESGALGRFAFAGRFSTEQTAGYRYHSDNRGNSGFVSGGWFGDRDILMLTAFAGVARNHLAYAAASAEQILADPRTNPVSPLERDHFAQQFASLQYTHVLSTTSALSATAFAQHAGGEYDVFFDPDVENFNLRYWWYGALTSYRAEIGPVTLDLGGNASTYHRDHRAFLRPDIAAPLYDNTGYKNELSLFAKASYAIGALTLFGDVQWRRAEFRYEPDAHADIQAQRIAWSFINPKGGATFTVDPHWSVYASYGQNRREPTRNDMFAGFDNLDTSNVAFVGALDRVRPERVRDLEAGATFRGGVLDLHGNLYAMEFRDEIAPIGQLSYIGLPLRKNVPRSYRRGVELDAAYRGIPRLLLAANATLSANRIAEYTDDATGQSYRDVEPLLTPRLLATASARFDLTRAFGIELIARHVARSYLANTGDSRFVAPASTSADGIITWRLARSSLALQLVNLTNARIYPAGSTDGVSSFYYVQPRGMFFTVRLRY
ncbi:MAG: TonB-dependent receptor, partial [Gemmatimonadota bacterium]|nr:TonB-dependent receptor [Gemmatimonadota bacterium]